MKRLTGIIGLLCGIATGLFMLLNNPFSPPALAAAESADTYQWRSLEFFGISFTPAELLGVASGSTHRSLGAEEVRLASASIILLQDKSGQPAALATRLTAMNKSPDMFGQQVGVDTYTNIFWANAGSVMMHGYENRWPLVRNRLVATMNDSSEAAENSQFYVSAARPDKEPTGIVGGSGLFSGIGGHYTETIQRDPEQPDLYAGSITLDIAVR